ncbi:MAG: Type toxin-antitoxin system HipA family toxin YjjJ [Verrucomicrobiota bacterium]|nr:Type toxin-antitoxin system HipA family toxin YjjJ [Verrucomicrobiota bacterium]
MARLSTVSLADLRLHLQAGGPTSAQDLANTVGVDRRTVQRALATLGSEIEQLGKTRNTRYAARRPIQGQSGPLVISRFGVNGVAHEWAVLTPLYGGTRLEWASSSLRPDWADQVHDHACFCDGLPFFVTDLRPQGFLGRAIARQLPAAFGLPGDPRNWSDDQTLLYLREWGHDLPGNLVIGAAATALALNPTRSHLVTPETRAARYLEFAEQANAGAPIGSSVEGEQPKFTVWVNNSGEDNVWAFLVKFTDRFDTPTGRRWADLLAAEAIALELLTLASRGDADAATPQIFDFSERRFYQLERFDRVGPHGRRGVVSLRALHDAGFTGADTNEWATAAKGLHERGWISGADLRAVRLRRLFGRLIGNTDMHFGNLAFFLEPALPLALAPTYDMLPMLWAPRPGEATPAPDFSPAAPMPHELELWPEAAKMGEDFWRRVEGDQRVSEGFRPHAVAARRAIQNLRTRFG